MKFSYLFILSLSTLALCNDQNLDTPTPTFHGIQTPGHIETPMVSNCDSFYLVRSGDTCSKIASAEGISLNQFYSWNKNVGSTCNHLLLGYYVCVGVLGARGTPEPPRRTPRDPEKRDEATAELFRSIHTSYESSQPTSIPTPSPVQPGIINNCAKFYKVRSGDTCSAVASKAGISLSELYKWNPKVGGSCQDLYLGYYVCVGVYRRVSAV